MGMLRKKDARVGVGTFSGRKTLLVRIIVSQALVGALLVSMLSLYMFRQFSANSIREITRSSSEGLKQSVRVFETLWDSTYRYMNKEFLTSGLLMDAQNLTSFDPVFSGDVSHYLGNMVYNSGLFHSIYIYNGNADVLFSSLGPVKPSDDFYDQDLVRLLRSGTLRVSGTANNAVALRRMSLRNGVGPLDADVLSVLYSDNGFRSAMVFNIDLQVLQHLVAGGEAKSTARLLVLTDGGTVLADSTGNDLLIDMSAEPLFLAVNRSAPSGAVVREWEGVRRLVSWQHWRRQDCMDWWFVSVADYRMLLSGVDAFQRQVLAVAGLFILLSLVISLMFGRRVYQPISRLLERIRAGQSVVPDGSLDVRTGGLEAPRGIAAVRNRAKPVSELEYLSRTYDMLHSNVARLLSFETAGRGPIRRHCLLRLLHGEEVGKAELARSLSDKAWFFSSEGFRCVAIRFDDAAGLAQRHGADDMALLRFAVLNIADELFNTVMGVEAFEVSEEWLCLVLHVGDPSEVPTGQVERIRDVLGRIGEACRTHLALSVTAGIGEEVPLASDIRTSWQQAVQAADCRFTEGAGAVVFHSETMVRQERPYRYPAETERELLDALRAGDASRLDACLGRFCQEVAEYAPPEAMLALTQLSIVIQRYVDGCMATDEVDGVPAIPAPDAYETLEALRGGWSVLLAGMADCLRRKRENRHDEMLSRVRSRVEASYGDVNLTVELLAEEAGLSANYLRTLYKEAYGQSITEHLAALRFQEAKRLLKTTALPANRIAGMVGYQSGGYFYTAFRKATGMTPDEYRRSDSPEG